MWILGECTAQDQTAAFFQTLNTLSHLICTLQGTYYLHPFYTQAQEGQITCPLGVLTD
jgi:hypothetical protein